MARRRAFDMVVVVAWLLAFELEAFTSAQRHGPVALNAVIVAAAALGLPWRRRHPLPFQLLVGVCALSLSGGLTTRDHATVFGTFSILVPAYTVVAWARARYILPAITIWVVVIAGVGVVMKAPMSGQLGPLMATAVACAAGWVVRSQREVTAALADTNRRLIAERTAREQLAVAGERTRIARDLNTLVAREVTAMVVQAEVAQRQPTEATIATIEESGRGVLEQLRRILGVLRHNAASKQLEPQPGLDQIHALVERSRAGGQAVEFAVEGEPGALLAGIDLVTYRILEEILDDGRPGQTPIGIALRFGDRDLELDVRADRPRSTRWPTPTIRERVALYNGEVRRGECPGQLLIRLPRHTEVVFV